MNVFVGNHYMLGIFVDMDYFSISSRKILFPFYRYRK